MIQFISLCVLPAGSRCKASVCCHHQSTHTSPLLAVVTFALDNIGLQMSLLRSDDDMPVLRTTGINMVLGTDMKNHFDIMSRFQVLPLRTLWPPVAANHSVLAVHASYCPVPFK